MLGELGKGEKLFLEKHQAIHGKIETKLGESLSHPEVAQKISATIESIKKEIEGLPEVKREMSFHPTMSASHITNVLSQAIQLAINEGVDKSLQFIYQTGNPYLVDAFHDILIGHFLDLILKQSNGK